MAALPRRVRLGLNAGISVLAQPPNWSENMSERSAMTKHKTGTREEWLAGRLGLLKEEKELMRRSDEVARRRQQLPWVRVD